MSPGVARGSAELTGGPVDEVFEAIRATIPDLRIERLATTHPTDDDNVWFVGREGSDLELQIDSAPSGDPPFLLESGTTRETVQSVPDAVARLTGWLQS